MTNSIKENIVKTITFIIWPLGSFLFSLKNLKSKSTHVIIFLFFLLFGFTFIPENKAADSFRYREEFDTDKYENRLDFTSKICEYFTFDSNINDIYTITCNFIISRITYNYHYLFLLFSFVFSFFYLKSLHFLTSERKFDSSLVSYLIAFLFTFSNPIFNINGVRFWTAAWIGVYCIFNILINKKYKYFILVSITPLIHNSFYIFIFILTISILTCNLIDKIKNKRYEQMLIFLYILSIFFSNISLDIIGQYKEMFPQFIQNQIWSYTNEFILKDKSQFNSNLPLYAKVLNSLPNLYTNLLVIYFIKYREYISKKTKHYQIFVFILSFMIFVNFTASIPSMTRYLYLIIPITAYYWFVIFKGVKKLNFIVYIIPIAFFYDTLYLVRNINSVTDIYLYISNIFDLVYTNL